MTHWMRAHVTIEPAMTGLDGKLRGTGTYAFTSALLAVVLEIVMAEGPPPPAELRRMMAQIARHPALRATHPGELESILAGWTGRLLDDYGAVRLAIREAIVAAAVEPGVARLLLGCGMQMVRSDHALSQSELDAACYLALSLGFERVEVEMLTRELAIA